MLDYAVIMMGRLRRLLLVALGAILAVAGCGGDGHDVVAGDGASLTQALDSASPGDVIDVPAGTTNGSFRVPAGVTLSGDPSGGTVLASGDSGDPVVVLDTAGGSSGAAAIEHVEVRSSGQAGVAVVGAGSARITEVAVEASAGVGVGAQDASELHMTDVDITGGVTRGNVHELPLEPTPADTSTHGLVIVRVADAQLERVDVSGFALFGALLVESTTQWVQGSASDNVSVGLMTYAGGVTLEQLELCRTLGAFSLVPPYGAVFANNAAVDTSGLQVCDNDGHGLLHDDAPGHHRNLVAEGNVDTALWVQDTAGFELSGGSSRLSDNRFAGAVFVDSADVTINDAQVDNTRLASRVVGETGTVEVGDGIQLVRTATNVSLSDLRLETNHRAGMLLELGGGDTSGIDMSGVVATGRDAQLGVVAQNGTMPPGWDDGVERRGTVVDNDASFLMAGDMLDVVGAVAPSDLPAPEAVATDGLDAVGVVAPSD